LSRPADKFSEIREPHPCGKAARRNQQGLDQAIRLHAKNIIRKPAMRGEVDFAA
jgi:hypothetical protein